MTEESWFDSRQGQEPFNFLLCKASRLDLLPTSLGFNGHPWG